MNQVFQGWEKCKLRSIDSYKFPGKMNYSVLDSKFIIKQDWLLFVSPILLGPSLQTIEPAVGDSSESSNLYSSWKTGILPLAWKQKIHRY